MSNQEDLTPAQKELERTLAGLRPARGGVSRDQVMFRAGWAAARRRDRRWGAALAAAVIVAGIAAALPALRTPETKYVERVVYLPAAVAAPQAAMLPEPLASGGLSAHAVNADYLRLRQEVLEKGVDALPSPRGEMAHEDLQDIRAWLGGASRPTAAPQPARILPRWLLNGDRS